MKRATVWLHEDALRLTHPVFTVAPATAEILFIWDDTYLQQSRYSLKRLVFIYETVCSLPVKILRGETSSVLREQCSGSLYVPSTNNKFIAQVVSELSLSIDVHQVQDEPFIQTNLPPNLRRFAQYWKRAQTAANTTNGQEDA